MENNTTKIKIVLPKSENNNGNSDNSNLHSKKKFFEKIKKHFSTPNTNHSKFNLNLSDSNNQESKDFDKEIQLEKILKDRSSSTEFNSDIKQRMQSKPSRSYDHEQKTRVVNLNTNDFQIGGKGVYQDNLDEIIDDYEEIVQENINNLNANISYDHTVDQLTSQTENTYPTSENQEKNLDQIVDENWNLISDEPLKIFKEPNLNNGQKFYSSQEIISPVTVQTATKSVNLQSNKEKIDEKNNATDIDVLFDYDSSVDSKIDLPINFSEQIGLTSKNKTNISNINHNTKKEEVEMSPSSNQSSLNSKPIILQKKLQSTIDFEEEQIKKEMFRLQEEIIKLKNELNLNKTDNIIKTNESINNLIPEANTNFNKLLTKKEEVEPVIKLKEVLKEANSKITNAQAIILEPKILNEKINLSNKLEAKNNFDQLNKTQQINKPENKSEQKFNPLVEELKNKFDSDTLNITQLQQHKIYKLAPTNGLNKNQKMDLQKPSENLSQDLNLQSQSTKKIPIEIGIGEELLENFKTQKLEAQVTQQINFDHLSSNSINDKTEFIKKIDTQSIWIKKTEPKVISKKENKQMNSALKFKQKIDAKLLSKIKKRLQIIE